VKFVYSYWSLNLTDISQTCEPSLP